MKQKITSMILNRIELIQDGMNITEICTALQCNYGHVLNNLMLLFKKGLIKRVKTGREVTIFFTPKGIKLKNHIIEINKLW